MSGTTTVPDLTRAHREGFIETLEALAPDEWLTPSLCDQWRVVDVAAHLAWAPALGTGAGAVALARHGLSMNRMIDGCAIEWSRRDPRPAAPQRAQCVAGVRLVTTDAAWSRGDGPEARGCAEALLLVLFGRRPGSGELSGPGAEVVLRR